MKDKLKERAWWTRETHDSDAVIVDVGLLVELFLDVSVVSSWSDGK